MPYYQNIDSSFDLMSGVLLSEVKLLIESITCTTCHSCLGDSLSPVNSDFLTIIMYIMIMTPVNLLKSLLSD